MMAPRATGLYGRMAVSRRWPAFTSGIHSPHQERRSMSSNSRVRNLLCLGVVTWTFVFGMTSKASGADKPVAKKDAKAAGSGEQVDFEKDVQPIFDESCVRCHRAGGGGQAGGRERGQGRGPGGPGGGGHGPGGGLRLDDKAAALKGGKHGKVIAPGKANDSLLFKVLKDDVKVGSDTVHRMPKARGGEGKKLSDDQIDVIKRWIDQGAKWSDAKPKK
jgi:hypothetical protein